VAKKLTCTTNHDWKVAYEKLWADFAELAHTIGELKNFGAVTERVCDRVLGECEGDARALQFAIHRLGDLSNELHHDYHAIRATAQGRTPAAGRDEHKAA
jgi:hypothetical protein